MNKRILLLVMLWLLLCPLLPAHGAEVEVFESGGYAFTLSPSLELIPPSPGKVNITITANTFQPRLTLELARQEVLEGIEMLAYSLAEDSHPVVFQVENSSTPADEVLEDGFSGGIALSVTLYHQDGLTPFNGIAEGSWHIQPRISPSTLMLGTSDSATCQLSYAQTGGPVLFVASDPFPSTSSISSALSTHVVFTIAPQYR